MKYNAMGETRLESVFLRNTVWYYQAIQYFWTLLKTVLLTENHK